VPFIDWSPFFHTWEMRGRLSGDPGKRRGEALFDDAQALLQEIVSRKLLAPRGIYGFFPAELSWRRRRTLYR